MKYYIEITLLPNDEIPIYFLWQKLYQQIHLGLVEIKDTNGNVPVAASFPKYSEGLNHLGCRLRLFASTRDQLQQLNIDKWLSRLTDYCHCTSIKEVPQSVNTFARFERKQFKTNIERRARRRIKSTGESLEQAIKYLKARGFEDKETKLPYIYLESSSSSEDSTNRHKYRLFIEKNMVDEPMRGVFSTYGLSKTATVPWF